MKYSRSQWTLTILLFYKTRATTFLWKKYDGNCGPLFGANILQFTGPPIISLLNVQPCYFHLPLFLHLVNKLTVSWHLSCSHIFQQIRENSVWIWSADILSANWTLQHWTIYTGLKNIVWILFVTFSNLISFCEIYIFYEFNWTPCFRTDYKNVAGKLQNIINDVFCYQY